MRTAQSGLQGGRESWMEYWGAFSPACEGLLPRVSPFSGTSHLEIKAKIEERLRNVPAANRERAFINAAKTEAGNQTVRPNGVRV